MTEAAAGVRLRQAVLVASELEPVAARLRSELGLGEPYADPGVAEFGLRNAVYALGDTFLEVVSPSEPGTAAGRHLERRGGDGGYMVIFQLDDLEAARARVESLGIRVVWRIDLPDISGTHLHPADMRGAIVSLDRAEPPGSWRWGGPDWTGREGAGAPGRLAGVTLEVSDPDAVAARWAEVLSVPAPEGERPVLALDGGSVAFEPADAEGEEGLAEIGVEVPHAVRRDREVVEVGGVLFRLLSADPRR
jgi:hypothetical protein